MNKILQIITLAGLSAHSSAGFSLAKTDIALDAPFAPKPQAVFFTQENGQFTPKCQVSVERYPEILPPQLAKGMNNRPALTNQNSALDLETCGPQLSLSLANEIKSGFQPEIAAVGLIGAAASITACVAGAWLTYKGAYYIGREEEETKTKGYLLTAIGGLGGAASVTAINHLLFRGSEAARLAKWVGGYAGAFCSVTGGLVGYWNGSDEKIYSRWRKQRTERREQTLKEDKERVAELEKNLKENKERVAELEENLKEDKERVAELEPFLNENSATVTDPALKMLLKHAWDSAQRRVFKTETLLQHVRKIVEKDKERLDYAVKKLEENKN